MGNNNISYETLTKFLATVLIALMGVLWKSVDTRLGRLENDVSAIKTVVVPIAGKQSARVESVPHRPAGVDFNGQSAEID